MAGMVPAARCRDAARWFESSIALNVLYKVLTEDGFLGMRPESAIPTGASQPHTHHQGTHMDTFTEEREIEVSIPAYVAA